MRRTCDTRLFRPSALIPYFFCAALPACQQEPLVAPLAQALTPCGPNLTPRPLSPLRGTPVPEPANLTEFVKDRSMAIALGKALFWDMQVGSDGIQSCASCHFRAGADPRGRNQLNPGALAPTFHTGGPNHPLSAADFPLRRLLDVNNRASPVLADSDDVVSSQGVARTRFLDVIPGSAEEISAPLPDPVFQIGGLNTRRVEPRNTPTVINAALTLRSFWDGRAQHEFNGVNPAGTRDPSAQVLLVVRGEPQPTTVRLPDAALASQAVGPPLSDLEMSHAGRTFPKLGKKLLALRPLGKQQVHRDDSVLGRFARAPQPGLSVDYATLIRAAFQPHLWNSPRPITLDERGAPVVGKPGGGPARPTSEYSVMEYNFSLFFGIAVQLYEATLIADDTPVDRHLAGDPAALSPQQRRGLQIFTNNVATSTLPAGRCITCHDGPELTQASAQVVRLQRLARDRFPQQLRDTGTFAIGVRPAAEDPGVGGSDAFGPLSDAALAALSPPRFVDPALDPPLGACLPGDSRLGVQGAFKIPALRNVELTAPYFHNGGQATLRQVVDFYNRGADFAPALPPLNLDEADKEALVAFLRGLTDERVRLRQAPFDHPELWVPVGHTGDEHTVVAEGGRARDELLHVPAVGRGGGPPLPGFLE